MGFIEFRLQGLCLGFLGGFGGCSDCPNLLGD